MEVRRRAPRESDLEAVLAIHADPRTNRHNPAGPLPGRAAAQNLLATWLGDWRTSAIGYWAIERRPDGEVVGFVGVRRIQFAAGELFNLYYRLAPAAWGQGIATRFAREAVACAHEGWPEVPVMARMQPTNTASQRTALAAGLERVGHDRWGRIVLADRPLQETVLDLLPDARPGA